jgi:CelD/BcsL family acetyltransferase involved in cellulose biosynthesis
MVAFPGYGIVRQAARTKVLEQPVKKGAAGVALEVETHRGVSAPTDEAAQYADPRHAFLRRAWFQAAGQSLTTLVAKRADGRVIAALPSFRVGPGLRAVPGSYWPYRSFPVAADTGDEELAAFLSSREARKALGPLWRLGPIYEDDATAARLLTIGRAGGWTILVRRLGTSYRLDIDALEAEGSWPRTSTLRKNRWIERRLEEFGELQWRTISGREWSAEAFDALAEIERNGWVWKNTDRSGAKFAAPESRRFWEQAVADPRFAEMASAALLFIGGTPAAYAFSIHTGRTRFARHSLGRALLYRDFQRAIELGAREIGWGSGDSGYKTEMGAVPGPKILDLLFIRSRALAALARPLWERSAGKG